MSNIKAHGGLQAKPQEEFREYIVEEPCELLDFLLATLKNKSRNSVKALLTYRAVAVNKKRVKQHNFLLKAGQTVQIYPPPKYTATGPEETINIDIIYEDDEILVINKPYGLLSIASDKEKENTAYRQMMEYVRLADKDSRIFVVHRLDRDTSGVLMAAKNEEVKHLFQDNWAEIVKTRGYTAMVEGIPTEQEGTIRSWLKETKTHLVYSSEYEKDGQEAITHYHVSRSGIQYSLLDIRIETGRKNQIRVHMKDMGHPIVGDKKYGAVTNPMKRVALHAHLLELNHPVTGELMRFEARIPKGFNKL